MSGYGSVRRDDVGTFQKKLDEAVQLAKKNEEIAGDVLEEMKYQRVTLDKAHKDLTVMENISSSAKSMIQVIRSKSNRKEYILKTIIVLLFVLDVTLMLIVIKNGGSLFSKS